MIYVGRMLTRDLQPGTTFAVCDAGGSTVDTTVYSVNSTGPLRLEEVRASDCKYKNLYNLIYPNDILLNRCTGWCDFY